jgi:pyruvate/2-oxoglutarate dehydrogenase complex dihydrolipoamide acyltransferase (E2) component
MPRTKKVIDKEIVYCEDCLMEIDLLHKKKITELTYNKLDFTLEEIIKFETGIHDLVKKRRRGKLTHYELLENIFDINELTKLLDMRKMYFKHTIEKLLKYM